jgi:H+/Cl- antiporter ClcA
MRPEQSGSLEPSMLVQYLPGILVLVMISSVIAFLVARFVNEPRRAVIRSAVVSTVLLQMWAYMEIGFDFGFLAILAVISTASAAVVVAIVRSFRRSRRIVM